MQARMEPLGIIVFSCIMGTAGFSVILEAVRQLLNHTKTFLPYEGVVVGEHCQLMQHKGTQGITLSSEAVEQ